MESPCFVATLPLLARQRERRPEERVRGSKFLATGLDLFQLSVPKCVTLRLARRKVGEEVIHQPSRLNIRNLPQRGDHGFRKFEMPNTVPPRLRRFGLDRH